MIRRHQYVWLTALVIALLGYEHGIHALAPPPNPAHWTVEGLPKKPVAAGATFTIKLSAHILPGWHIYALDEPDGGPVPTQIGLAEGDHLTLLTVDEPAPRMVPDPVLHQPTGMFQNVVDFTLRLRIPRKLSSPQTASRILVRYQSCNDEVCLPPHTETVVLPLKRIIP
jgi:DsbC/DsbD-like thiol-disulfide interchange protein